MSITELMITDGPSAGYVRPRICIISMSAIADDPRVRRQGDAFARAGWEVVGVGLRGALSTPPGWTILTYAQNDVGAEVTSTVDEAPESAIVDGRAIPETNMLAPASPQLSEFSRDKSAQTAALAEVVPSPVQSPAPAGVAEPVSEATVRVIPPLRETAASGVFIHDTGFSPHHEVALSSNVDTKRKQLALLVEYLPWQAPILHRSAGLIDTIYYRALAARVRWVGALYRTFYNLRNARVTVAHRCYSAYYNWLNLRARFAQRCYALYKNQGYFSLSKLLRRVQQKFYALYYRMRLKRIEVLSKVVPGGTFSYASQLIRVRFQPGIADKLYWMMQSTIIELYELAQTVDAGVWLANDWIALPIAARIAKEKGGTYVYDTHEFAVEEYAEKLHWRMWKRPLVRAVERQYIGDAAVVSSVSAGISGRLDAMYQLPRPSLVVRNTPFYRRFRFRPTGERVRVLYHGIIVIGRGLEQTIDSVVSWRPEFELTLRGPENSGYSDMLRQRIRDAGLEKRVRLVPPVPMTALVEEATAFDIGFFALPGHSRHNEFALPNKFFEYMMAGLALCVSDLPEMARLVEEHQLGALIPTLDPAAIASAINSFDRERIDACKRNALAAAEELCWERESARMVTAYRQLVPETALG